MIAVENATMTYDGGAPVLRDVNFSVGAGEVMLVVGATGSGKSTLLAALSGQFPHSTGGQLVGSVTIDGRRTAEYRPRDLADVVGVVGQNPEATFVTTRVDEELAFTLEQLGVAPAQMSQRLEGVLDLLNLRPLATRALETLSAGEQQRVAIGAVLTAQPRVLILDEPTSALDPSGAAAVLGVLRRLAASGLAVVLAEHRIERVAGMADRVAVVEGGHVQVGTPNQVLPRYCGAGAVIELGGLLGWEPRPVTVAQARELADPIRPRLLATSAPPPPAARDVVLRARGLGVTHGAVTALDLDLDLHAGEVTALLGHNGAGKSTLLWALQGSGARTRGTVTLLAGSDGAGSDGAGSGRAETDGARSDAAGSGDADGGGIDTADLAPARAYQRITLLPQPAADLLFLDSVAAECRAAGGRVREHLAAFAVVDDQANPRDLSQGQQLALALAIQLCADAPIVLLDEPTRGLDALAKRALADWLRRLRAGGASVLVATHDVEFAAQAADRAVVLTAGRITADAHPRAVLVGPLATQAAQLFEGCDVLTTADVAQRLRVQHD